MFEGQQYTLECTVQNVAPVQNLTVTFYKGRTALREQSNSSQGGKGPVTKIFTLNISPSEEDDGVQYSCEAKLDLEMPQPPLVASQNISSTVYCEYNHNTSAHFISFDHHFALCILIFYLKLLLIIFLC